MKATLLSALLLFVVASVASAPLDLGEGPDVPYRITARDAQGNISYDPDSGMLYADQRVRLEQGEHSLEADTIAINQITREGQLEGDVIFQVGPTRFTADSVWYNFRTREGIAHNVQGMNSDFFFQGNEVRQLSEDEMLLREPPSGSEEESTARLEVPRFFEVPIYHQITEGSRTQPMMTTSDLRGYTIRAREFILYPGDRVFARHAVVEIQGIPVLYLPWFTLNLARSIPWEFGFGHSSLMGTNISIGYRFQHRLYEPDPITGELALRSEGLLRPHVEWFSKSGYGIGLDYEHSIDFGRHEGSWRTYFIEDDVRASDSRWLVHGASRWEVSENVVALIGAEMVSDPEMGEDFFDDFIDDYGRIGERRLFGAITLEDDDFIARASADWRDRLSADRFTNFSEPSDNNDDYTAPRDTDNDGQEEIQGVAFNEDLWGRVAERAEIDFTSNELKIGNTPVHYSWDVSVFNNLDAGLNRQSEIDDAHVLGIDVYQSLLTSIRLTDRLTLLLRGGIGAAVADRNEDTFGISGGFPQRVNNLIFASDDSVYVGTDMTGADNLDDNVLDGTEGAFATELLDLDNVDNGWVYADAMARLQARLSDSLTAYAQWWIREAAGDSIGEFYAELGQPTFLEDLHPFRLEEHRAEAGLRHRLRRPDLISTLFYRRNLQSDSEIYQGEEIQQLGAQTTYRNPRRTFSLTLGGGLRETQLRHPTDPQQIQMKSVQTHLTGAITPRHGIWYDQFGISALFNLDDDPAAIRDNDALANDLDEDANIFSIGNTLGVKLSPVWDLVWNVRWNHTESNGVGDDTNANSEFGVFLLRDLHDAVLSLGIQLKNDAYRTGDDEDNRVEATVGIRFRRSSEEPVGVTRPMLVVPQRRPGEIDEGRVAMSY